MSRSHMQARGLCPVCQRDVALLSDNTVAKAHKDKAGVWCSGYGLEGQPYAPVAPPPERIRVCRYAQTGRWRVTVGGRLAYVVDGFDEACRRAGQLSDRALERAVEATAERFGYMPDLERERWKS